MTKFIEKLLWIIFIVLTTLKVADVVHVSWLWITAPIWIPVLVCGAGFIFLVKCAEREGGLF